MKRESEHSVGRKAEILHSIVEAYIESGEPVASRTIARRRSATLSPASIRNIMADLCDEGFLSQPHTSAGRIPTEKAFQSYVQSVTGRRLHGQELERIREELGQAESLDTRAERSSHVLTELTRNVGIAAAIPTATQTLDRVELLSVPDRRVLMIVVTRDRMVRDRLVLLDESISQDELNSIRNYINENFGGWVFSDIEAELRRRLEKESAAYDAILRKLAVFFGKGLLDLGLTPEVHLEGASNLVGLELHLTGEKLRELFRALEQKKKILQLLERFLERPNGEVGVQVGLGDIHPSMRQLSLIGICVSLPSGMSARIAVLGPMRMNYAKVISAVYHVGQTFRSLPS